MERGARNTSFRAVGRSRTLRSEMSVGESILWGCLRKEKLGFRFRRQVPIGPYIVDFYCPEASLAVEVDGEQHLEQQFCDAKRDAFLRTKGVEVLRIPSVELCGSEPHHWIDGIAEACQRRIAERS